MFDLVISNPPYGKSSSLSKKIVNKMLESKVAKEMVVLAPPKSFQDKLQTIVSKIDIGLTSDHFDIPVANGVKVFICKMILDKESNESWEHFLLSKKELVYLEAGMGGFGTDFGKNSETLVLNSNNKLVKYILDNPEEDITQTICAQLYDLAVLANKPLTAEELTRFVNRSNDILAKLI